MDTINSFKGYGKVDPKEEEAFKRKTRKRLIFLVVSVIVLVGLIIGVVVGVVSHKKNKDDSGTINIDPNSSSSSIKAICSMTNYPDSCYSSISSMQAASNTTDPEKLFQVSLQVAMNALEKISVLPQELMNKTEDAATKQALGICQAVFDDAIQALNDSISSMNVGDNEKILSVTKIGDLRTWLSTTLTDQETCLDTLAEANATILEDVRRLIKDPNEFTSNSLAIGSKLLTILSNFNIPIHRKLLDFPDDHVTKSGFPHWLGAADRRLLQEVNPKPDVIVAQDGTGDVKTINEAVAKVPLKSLTRFVIYVKSGTYNEQVSMSKSVWNVLMYGDGKAKTIIAFDKNFADGTQTFDTATFAVAGKNFMAKDIAFKNTAGAIKHQAVAVRSGSDHSVFYGCLFHGYQDTLYAHSNRQFYRDCDVTGTIDFIFGNAAVVFQNCNIQPRQPLTNQFVTITAQGKKDSNQNTGISIHECILSPLDSLTAPTYLGRPWKEFSTTVIMESNIGAFLSPLGWTPWDPTITPSSTIYYAEYLNTGPGANVDKRVKWAKPTITSDQASKFMVKSFIDGEAWLPATQVKFT